MATVLARRGFRDPDQVREFLAADETHDPDEFDRLGEIVELVSAAVGEGRPITVYGDFDCDGVCATAILVAGIRELGGQCDWFIPDRIDEGYGLNAEAIRRIAGRGTSLVITVDCGVTSVEEVRLARELGLEIVVTDHHQVGPALPDCPILHPVVSGYPFPSLCGAAVAAKLASALRRQAGQEPGRDEADLDLVALATVADVMPLTGENRHLVSAGIKVARRSRRIGLVALMADSRVEPSRLTSKDFGFRLAPRINAAGRLYRADAGVELFLAESRERADEIAAELASANSERRRIEREVESEAKAALRAIEKPGPAVVVAGEGWHPGVVGIVASKLVKATGHPAVVISIDGEAGRGSGRSVPGLDLHGALTENSELLETFGGHAAAAGLTIRTDRIDRFREALGATVAAHLGEEPREPGVRFDAVAGGAELDLDLAEEVERLEPFGNGNPAVNVLIPGAVIEGLQEMGEGKHCRFSICTGSHRAKGVAFGRNSLGLGDDERADVIAEIGLNHWNGSVEPQLRVVEVNPVTSGSPLPECEADEWWQRFESALETEFTPSSGAEIDIEIVGDPDRLPGVTLAELISSGERLAIITADARQRWQVLGGSSLSRFLPEGAPPDITTPVIGLWAGSPGAQGAESARAGVLLTDYFALTGPTAPDLSGYDRIALLDPPFLAAGLEAVAGAGVPVHLLGGPDEFAFAGRIAAHRLELTAQLRELFRSLLAGADSGSGDLAGESLRTALESDGNTTRSPEESAVLLRVLVEVGLARSDAREGARVAGVVSSKKVNLSGSAVFAHHIDLHEEHHRFLSHFDTLTRTR